MPAQPATSAEPLPRLFNRNEYHAMGESGILGPQDRVELINGRIVSMMPLGPWHSGKSNKLDYQLKAKYGNQGLVTLGNPVGLGDDSEPQPDCCVLAWRDDFYETRHPAAIDVILRVEVSDSSRVFDLGTKQDLYAKHGIAEYWVIDKQMAGIHVFRLPTDGVYREMRIYRPGESIPLPQIEGQSLEVGDFVSPAS